MWKEERQGRDSEKLFESEDESLRGTRGEDEIRGLNLIKKIPPFLTSTMPGHAYVTVITSIESKDGGYCVNHGT